MRGLLIRKAHITKGPQGEAPDWVKNQWIGLRLPVSSDDFEGEGLINVNVTVALDIMATKSPEAVEWFLNSMLPTVTRYFSFNPDCLEIIEEPITIIMDKCPNCWTGDDYQADCHCLVCYGTGRVAVDTNNYNLPVDIWLVCPICNGLKKFGIDPKENEAQPCYYCKLDKVSTGLNLRAVA